MTTAGQPTGYFNQTYAVEFTVTGSLDGTTLQPPLLDSPPADVNLTDPQRLFRRTVTNLGLIDPDYTVPVEEDGRRGTRGNRLVTYIWITGPIAGVVGASIEVVDAVDGTPLVQKPIGSLVGKTSFFREGIFIPQGSMLRVSGLSSAGGEPVKVRLHIQYLDNAEDLAAALEVVCCLDDGSPDGIAGGDLGQPGGAPTVPSPIGAYPNPTVVAVQNRRVDPAAPLFQQALLWNGLSWAPNFIGVSQLYFGAEILPGAGPFFLPPGFDLSGTALPATEIPVKATQNQNLRFLHIQQTPGVGGGTITYSVFVGGVATALAVTLPITGTDANNVVALPFAASNQNISVQVSYIGAVITPPSRVTVNMQGVAA